MEDERILTTNLLENSVLRIIFYRFAQTILFLMRWNIKGSLPDTDKFVLIAAPHSSNWDFVFFMLVIFRLKIPVNWMAKHTLFARPFKWLLIKLGGIPIDRTIKGNTVRTMIRAFAESDRLILTIAPSGTRSKTRTWKTGFYHIAFQAGVPIVCGYIDYPNRTVGIGPTFYPTGKIDTEMIKIQDFYKPFSGKYITQESR